MVGPVGGILANLIAFVAFFAFLDAIVIWLFGIIHLENFGLTVNFFILKFLKLFSFIFIFKLKIVNNAVFILASCILNGS